ncbi:serine/threonine-protein kinase [Streptomyces cavernicola]|uniref:Protein kinase n=1 Tax=Streptomyces cavernicola TaxID=3043613 RepID=A0ABT6SJH4_9ACTN|nr:serine/threonine-protein kinase [Streptomyces sp. B-S-A6]MDI3407812.1 protein kinase [Streptomyces sp. B-S-A6]
MDELGASDPRTIGAYRLLGRLGSGGMGQVFLARSTAGRTVAVKLVREELAEQEEFRSRFRQEVDTARQVAGPWTAPVLDADTEADRPWLATGYVAGPSLHAVVAREHGPLPERSVRILTAGLAHALREIHAAGVVHRDLKLSNVLLTIDGPRVIDFGIARALETVTDGGLTRAGALVGSPGFMAPEQVRGDRITPACDVFCLGSVLAYAATGRLPFGAENSGAHALMFRIAQEEPDLRGLPKALRELVRSCLAKDPQDRPALDELLRRTGAHDTLVDGRAREPWLPGTLIAQLGRHAVRLLDVEDPGAGGSAGARNSPGAGHSARAGASAGAASGAAASDPNVRVPEPRSPADDRPAPAPPAHPPIPGPGPGPGPEGATPEPTLVSDPAADRPADRPAGGARPLDDLPTLTAEAEAAAVEAGAETGAEEVGPAEAAETTYRAPRSPRTPRDPHAQAAPGPPQPIGFGHPATGGASAALPGGGPAPEPPFGSDAWYARLAEQDRQDRQDQQERQNRQDRHEPPHPRSNRTTAFLVAVAAAVAIGAGGSVYAMMKGEGPGSTDQGESPAPTAPATPSPDRNTASDGAVPQAYLGTWQARFEAGGGTNTRTLTLTQGDRGEQVMRLEGSGPNHDCSWTAVLRSADEATLTLGPSTVTRGDPGSCKPGPVSELTLPDDRTLVRELIGSGGTPLTYTRTTGR